MSIPHIVNPPRILMFEEDGKLVCHLYMKDDDSYQGYGLMICDLIRHVALAFDVSEDDVFEWVRRLGARCYDISGARATMYARKWCGWRTESGLRNYRLARQI